MADNTTEGPFSQQALNLFQRLQRETSKEARIRLTKELGKRFAKEYDPSDETATDDYHVYFEEFAKAELAYEQAALRIGRLAADCIKQFYGEEAAELDGDGVEDTKSLN